MKFRKKITAAFLGLALIGLVAGFCDSLINGASASMDEGMVMNEKLFSPNGQMHFSPSAVLISAEKNLPIENSLKPCCVDKHSSIPVTETQNFISGTKLSALNVEIDSPNLTYFFENKLDSSSDSSPPKPDELSSVLRLE